MMTFHVHFVSVSYETRGSLRSREAKNTAFRTYVNETRSVYDTNGKKIKKKKNYDSWLVNLRREKIFCWSVFVRSLKERYEFGSCRGGWVQQSLHYGRRDCRKAGFNALLMHSETPFLPLLRPPSTIDKAWPWKRDECARRRPVDFQAPLFLHRPSSFPLARGSNLLVRSFSLQLSCFPSICHCFTRTCAVPRLSSQLTTIRPSSAILVAFRLCRWCNVVAAWCRECQLKFLLDFQRDLQLSSNIMILECRNRSTWIEGRKQAIEISNSRV